MTKSIGLTTARARFGKLLIAASAVAGFGFLFAQDPSSAASASYCTSYAREVASCSVPTHVTINQGRRFRRSFEEAYASCRSDRTKPPSTVEQRALTAGPLPSVPEQGGACDFSVIRERWMPTEC